MRRSNTARSEETPAFTQEAARRLYVETALAALRVCARERDGGAISSWRTNQRIDDPEILRAVAETLEIPYLLVAAAVYEVTQPETAPVSRADVEKLLTCQRVWPECTSEFSPNPMVVRVEAMRDALNSVLEEGMDLDPNSGDELRQIAAELGVPALLCGIIAAQHSSNARITMKDINDGLAWLTAHRIDPKILELQEDEMPATYAVPARAC